MNGTAESRRVMDFLDAQLFRPVLERNPDRFPVHQRGDAEALRNRLDGVRQKIQSAGSPEAMVRAFGQLSAEEGQSLDAKLTALGFPAVSDIRYDVEKLGAELGLNWQDDEPSSCPRGMRQDA